MKREQEAEQTGSNTEDDDEGGYLLCLSESLMDSDRRHAQVPG